MFYINIEKFYEQSHFPSDTNYRRNILEFKIVPPNFMILGKVKTQDIECLPYFSEK